MSFFVFRSDGLNFEDDFEDDYHDVDDEMEPICSVCYKPITFLDFAKYGKCKECRDNHE